MEERGTFAIDSKVPVSEIYDQLQQIRAENESFRWKSDITHGWAICDVSREHIYYAAPMRNADHIPNFQWISVHGSQPYPKLTVGKHQSEYHDVSIASMKNASNRSMNNSKHKSTRSNLSGQIIMEENAIQEESLPKVSRQEDSDEEQLEKENISDLDS